MEKLYTAKAYGKGGKLLGVADNHSGPFEALANLPGKLAYMAKMVVIEVSNG